MKISYMLLLIILFVAVTVNAVEVEHLFQSYFKEGLIFSNHFASTSLEYMDYEYANSFKINANGGYIVNSRMEVNGQLAFINFDSDFGGSESGISDLLLSGRYLISPQKNPFTAGAYLTLPIGSDKVGAGNFNFGLFSGIRFQLENGMILTGNLGLDFYEVQKWSKGKLKDEYENSLTLGFGSVFNIGDKYFLVPELNFKTKGDYGLLSFGFFMKNNVPLDRLRARLGLGLDDGAPDFHIRLEWMFMK